MAHLYNYTVAKVTMDCDQNVLFCAAAKTGVSAYRTVMEELIVPGETTTEFRDGLFVRIVQTDTTIKIKEIHDGHIQWRPDSDCYRKT
jgi:hypothetical protein